MSEQINVPREQERLTPQRIAIIKFNLERYEKSLADMKEAEQVLLGQFSREVETVTAHSFEATGTSRELSSEVIIDDERLDLSHLSAADREEFLRMNTPVEDELGSVNQNDTGVDQEQAAPHIAGVTEPFVDPRYAQFGIPLSVLPSKAMNNHERRTFPRFSKRQVVYGMGGVGLAAMVSAGGFVAVNSDNPESPLSQMPIIGSEFNKIKGVTQDIFADCSPDSLSDDLVLSTALGNASADVLWRVPDTGELFGPSIRSDDGNLYPKASFEEGVMDLAVCEADATSAIAIDGEAVHIDASQLTLQAELGFQSAGSDPIPIEVLKSTAESELITQVAAEALEKDTRDAQVTETVIDQLLRGVVDEINQHDSTAKAIQQAATDELIAQVSDDLEKAWPEKTFEITIDGELSAISPIGMTTEQSEKFELDAVTLNSIENENIGA